MSKPWQERPLWERVWLGPFSRIYLAAGKIIGHLGCSGFAYYDAAKLLPNYDKLRYENAMRDLTVYEPRERGEYVLTATAKKVLRIIIGPAPGDPEYAKWWRLRLISVEEMKRDGQKVEWAEAPPVPLEPAKEGKPADEPKPEGKKPARRPQKKPEAKKPRKKPAKG